MTLRAVALVAVLTALVLPARAPAQEPAGLDSLPLLHAPPIVVTATRTAVATGRVASSITVLTRGELERRQVRTVADALREVPGVTVARNGGPGAVTSVFLRGAGVDHTLVLVDGVEVNDPSSPSTAYDFATLTTDAVERIEVLRGPQSTLYGSSAMGGVIQIFTRGGGGTLRGRLVVEGGRRGAVLGAASVQGGRGSLRYVASASRRTTDGISAAAGGNEDDGHDLSALAARLTWAPAPTAELVVQVRGQASDAEIDQTGGVAGDDPNFRAEADEVTVRIEGRTRRGTDGWDQRLGLGLTTHDRETVDEPDPARPLDSSRGTFRGTKLKASWVHDVPVGEAGRLMAGIETERERARSRFASESAFGPFESALPEATAWTTGAFLEHRRPLGRGAELSAGARIDHHDRFGSAVTLRATGSWRPVPAGPRWTATWGTGFKAPTLFQLFDPQFGNPDLEPEESSGWDAGLEQELSDGRVRVGATVFGAEFEHLVGFAEEGFLNVDRARTRGLETLVSLLPVDALRLRATYTLTDAEDRSSGPEHGAPLIRRPRHAATVAVDWAPGPRGELALVVTAVGEREDLDFATFPAARVTLDRYTLVRLAGSAALTGRVRVHARIENALDVVYEEVLGFGAPGRAVHAGVSIEL